MNSQLFIEMRFLLGLASMLIMSMQKIKSWKANSLIAIFIIWITFGLPNSIYFFISVFLNIFLLWKFQPNEYFFTVLNIFILYIYKFIGKYIDPRIGGTFDISGILMIQTVKTSYIAKYFDNSMPNVLNYLLFTPGLVTGPIMPYDVFIKRDTSVKVKFPTKQLLITLGYVIVYSSLKTFPFLDYVLDSKNTFIAKIVYLYLYNICGRTKFHFAWNFAHCCFILRNFPEYLNIDFNSVEIPQSVAEISAGWNKFINIWIKTIFYLPIKPKSTILAIMTSVIVAAFLHGINLGYLIFVASFSIYRSPISRANKFLRLKTLKQIQMIFFIMYFSMPFYLLNVFSLLRLWRSVYFFGHIYFSFWFLVYWFEKLFMKPSTDVKANENKDENMKKVKNELDQNKTIKIE